MRICDSISADAPIFSFEFFPPKTAAGEKSLFATIDRLRPLEPTFVSVTYGAGGSTQQKTVELVSAIKHDIGIEAMAHLTCVGANRDQIREVLDLLAANGIDNVLPLRGDPPKDQPQFSAPANGFRYASELTKFIREQGYGFCLAGAAYPEGHLESSSLEQDLLNLKTKVGCGSDFLITQLFFDNKDYFSFIKRAPRGRH